MSTTETCLYVTSLFKKFSPLRRKTEAGRAVIVTDREYEFLVPLLQAALLALAKQAGGVIPVHLVDDMARYMRAVYSAEVVDEGDTEGMTAQGGVA